MTITQIKHITNPDYPFETIQEDQLYEWADEAPPGVCVQHRATAAGCVKMYQDAHKDKDCSDWDAIQDFIAVNWAAPVPDSIDMSKYNHEQQLMIHRYIGQLRKA